MLINVPRVDTDFFPNTLLKCALARKTTRAYSLQISPFSPPASQLLSDCLISHARLKKAKTKILWEYKYYQSLLRKLAGCSGGAYTRNGEKNKITQRFFLWARAGVGVIK